MALIQCLRLSFFLCLLSMAGTGSLCAQAPAQSSSPVSSGLSAGENLIKNPSFENPPGSYWWCQKNWPKPVNQVEFTLDPDNPHSGSYSQRISLIHVNSTPNLQFATPVLPVRPGMSLQFRCWARGLPNTKPIQVIFRKSAYPYTIYFQADIGLTKDWTESVFNLTLPPNTDPKDTILFFQLMEENTFWLDDISLTELPSEEGGAPLVGNQLKNGSFEVGRDHWYATFREAAPDQVNRAYEGNAHANLVAQPEENAPNGRNVLAYQVFPGCVASLTSAYFHLRYGHPASIGFWFKSSAVNRPFYVRLGQGKFPNQTIEGQAFTPANAGWNFYHMVATPKASTTGTSYLEFSTSNPGKYELDGVNVVEGETSNPVFPSDRTDAGWISPEGTPPGNLFHLGDTISFPLSIAAPPGQPDEKVALRMVDYRDHEIKSWNLLVPLDAQGYGQTAVSLPSDRLGGFKVSAYASKDAPSGTPDADLLYSVLPRLKPLSEAGDSYFGSHLYLTPYNLAVAEQLGVRWLRLNPPVSTDWAVIEQQKGKFDFYTGGVARAHALGFHILGLIFTTPRFYADAPPKNATNPDWHASFYPPADWDAWRNYVQKTTTAFAPYVQAWEIWNEPNGQFMQVKPNEDRAADYVKIAQQTRKAVEDEGLNVLLVGNAAGSLDGAFTWQELALGGGKEVDAISFHLYNETSGPDEKRPPLADQLAKVRSYQNRSGQTPEIWNTEGGIWLFGGRSWMDSEEIPSSVSTSVADATNSTARSLIGNKALGVQRQFYYQTYAEPSGRIVYRDECAGMIDVNGVPNPAGAAYAAAVYFLEDATAIGLDVRAAGAGHVTVAKFKGPQGLVTVVWSRDSINLSQIPDLDWKKASAFDLMGNPITLTADTTITLDPIYMENKD